MRAIRRGLSKSGDRTVGISQAQSVVLNFILVNGPSSASDIASLSPSTAQVSMKRLNDVGLVQLEREEPIKTGLPKKIYGLTMGGFCFGFSLIAQSVTTTYEMLENAIKRWQHLCPNVLGNWDLLVKERQELCPPPDNFDKNVYDYSWLKKQLPYPVPWVGVNLWIFYLNRCCREVTGQDPWGVQMDYSVITSDTFDEAFIMGIIDCVMQDPIMTNTNDLEYGPAFYDTDLIVRIIQTIPIIWEPLHAELVDLKVWHEKCVLRTQQLLEN